MNIPLILAFYIVLLFKISEQICIQKLKRVFVKLRKRKQI